MNIFEDNPEISDGDSLSQPEPLPSSQAESVQPSSQSSGEIPPGDPFTYGATHPQPYHFVEPEKRDIDVPWSWGNFFCFVPFAVVSLFFIQAIFMIYYIQTKAVSARPTQKELQQLATSRPIFAVGSMVLWYAAIFLFFYFTIRFFYGKPFWESLRWRKFSSGKSKLPPWPWLYVISGVALSFLVMVVTAHAKAPENAPIQEILKNPKMAFAFMGMAVLIAPFAEETIFRAYLYPLFAKTFGIWPGIILTAILFGIMHGTQLGWAWPIVISLTGVGVVFAFVRSRTETVLASYLMHLAYNSTLAFLFVIAYFLAKYGKIPPPHH
jgi:membrane protease YdiL (CAAX protease family)